MPFDIVDASSRGRGAEHLGAYRVHTLVVGRGLRRELGEVSGQAQVARGGNFAGRARRAAVAPPASAASSAASRPREPA